MRIGSALGMTLAACGTGAVAQSLPARDDLGELADADWIVEAIVERLDIKRAL